MVSWGENTVYSVPANQNSSAPPAPSLTSSPSAFNFCASAPAPSPVGSFSFGSTPSPARTPGTGLFSGTSAPSVGLFGSSPAPAGTGLFGGSAPAPPSSGFFGSSTAPSSSIFGGNAPAPGSLFGTSSTSSFGSQPQQQQPAHAALLAHMDASARQESERVKAKLEKIYLAYTGQAVVAEGSDESSKFVTITYNEMSPQEKQMQIMANIHFAGSGLPPQIIVPVRPSQVSPQKWEKACVENPDPSKYVPVALVGATALQARLSWQQEQAKTAAANAKSVEGFLKFIHDREISTRNDLYEKERKYSTLRFRLLNVMRKVEIARALNKPIQQDEYKAFDLLQTLFRSTVQMRTELTALQDQAHRQQQEHQRLANYAFAMTESIFDKKQMLLALEAQGRELDDLKDMAKADVRDVNLVSSRVMSAMSRPF